MLDGKQAVRLVSASPAKAAGLDFVVLTDHNLEALPPAEWRQGILLVPAVELSTDGRIVNDREFVAPRDVQFVDVAWNGSTYLVAWVQDQMSEVRAVMLDRTLTPRQFKAVLLPA